jgi:uncharacterized protein with ParB-like and HNH nuclease domain
MEMSQQLNELKRNVDFSSYDISVKELISMFKEGLIDIAPEYQRQFRWEEDRQSSFIESIFLGIPIPSLFMATNVDGTWELIDGVQRLSSLIHFCGDDASIKSIGIKSNLVLTELTKLTSFNTCEFKLLSKAIQNDFLLKPLKVITLTDKSDLQVRFDLFERLNTGGVRLTPQEIRSCIFRGNFADFLKELSKSSEFNKVVNIPAARENDGTKEEFILRFFAFYYNYKNFDHSVTDFLNTYMKEATKKFDYKKSRFLFEKTFKQLSRIKSGIVNRKRQTPVNLFEGVAVGAAMALKTVNSLDISEYSTWIKSQELEKYVKGPTNSRPNVAGRIEYCRDRFLGK